ncbi:hypothetical protein CAP48_06945 [Advenella sp. S44]|nr:hypothetical protein CAP48_06945 [Advenella sp. S44]
MKMLVFNKIHYRAQAYAFVVSSTPAFGCGARSCEFCCCQKNRINENTVFTTCVRFLDVQKFLRHWRKAL